MKTRRSVLEALEGLPVPDEGQLILACIEGPGGSGKSTLADQITRAYSGLVTVVHGDDFYGPEERDWRSWTAEEGYLRYFDHRRLERELLQPLRRGDTAQFRRYDWSTNSLDGLVEVWPRGIVLVECVYLLRMYLRPYWDFAIYVDTPREGTAGARECAWRERRWLDRPLSGLGRPLRNR